MFAIVTAIIKQPWLGLAMLGVIPASLFMTVWQLQSQKRVRLSLLRVNEQMDGTVVEQLGGVSYVYATGRGEAKITIQQKGHSRIPAGAEVTIGLDPVACLAFDGAGLRL